MQLWSTSIRRLRKTSSRVDPTNDKQMDENNEEIACHKIGEANLFNLNQMMRSIEFPAEVMHVDFTSSEKDANSCRSENYLDTNNGRFVLVCLVLVDGMISIYDYTMETTQYYLYW